MDPSGRSAFGLLIGCSCDIGLPSSAKNVTKLSGVGLTCFRLSAQVLQRQRGSKLSAWIDAPSGVLDAGLGRLVLGPSRGWRSYTKASLEMGGVT
ncbi:hypothetical protein BHM03_00057925 [Ensete ventricosum]|nr:hypothetical protein BHM03_00057925 [Ensete ventricosum]